MIDLSHGIVARFERQIAALPPFGCWAKVIIEDPETEPERPDYRCVRIHVQRRRDGAWHFSLQELGDAEAEWSPHLQWENILTDFDERGDPHALMEVVIHDAVEIPAAMAKMIAWASSLWIWEPSDFALWVERQWREPEYDERLEKIRMWAKVFPRTGACGRALNDLLAMVEGFL